MHSTINNETVLYPDNGILYSNENEQTTTVHSNVDES